MMTIMGAALTGDLSEFKSFYERGMAESWRASNGDTLLTIALGNKNRIQICNFLLDEGADASVTLPPEGTNCLHILLGRVPDKNIRMPGVPEKNAADLALLHRLLDGGAEINAVDTEVGTPIQYFTEGTMKLPSEEVATPFYDLLFSREDLDLMKIGAFGRSTYWSIWSASFRSTVMLECAQRCLRERGLPVPDLGEPPQPAGWPI